MNQYTNRIDSVVRPYHFLEFGRDILIFPFCNYDDSQISTFNRRRESMQTGVGEGIINYEKRGYKWLGGEEYGMNYLQIRIGSSAE